MATILLHPRSLYISKNLISKTNTLTTRDLQPSKALSPMWVTEFGMVKLAKELQPEKASPPMWVTEFGMVKLTRALQP